MARANNDQMHLCRLRDAYAQTGCLPSYRHIANILNFKAKNAAFKLSQRLIASGHLVKTTGGRLAPGPAFFTSELNSIETESNYVSTDNFLHPQSVNQLLSKGLSKTAFVAVNDDSLSKEGVLKGDVAIVDVDSRANRGDIIIAEINGTRFFKEFGSEEKQQQSGNESWRCMHTAPEEIINIIGIVRGIVRSYRPTPNPAVKMNE